MKDEYVYEAKLKRVIDGDTLELIVDLGFGVLRVDKFRLLGVNTPEVYGVKKTSEEYARGKIASAVTEQWFEDNGEDVIIRSYDAQKAIKTGKYGRWLIVVYPLNSNPSLNDILVSEGYKSG